VSPLDPLSLTPFGVQGPVGDGGACAMAEEHVHLDQLHSRGVYLADTYAHSGFY
jgi:hypothetical protein